MRLSFLVFFLVGCSGTQLASTIQTADALGRGVAHVLGWCEQNGATPSDLIAAVEDARKGDYGEALRLAALMVEQAKQAGHEPPSETATVLALAQELEAARAVEQAARALAGRDAEGKPK